MSRGVMSNRLGLDFISTLAMPPVAHVELAATLGCGGVSLALAPFTANPHGYPTWSLRDDAALRRDLKAALAANVIELRMGEGFLIRPGSDVADSAADLDLMAELGCQRVNILTIDGDVARSVDELGRFTVLAAARGLSVTLEYMAGMAVGNLNDAVAAIHAVNSPHISLMVDALHLDRGGNTPADVARLDPALIGYVQICDALHQPVDASYGEDARHNRLELGSGELPLAALIAAVPDDVPVSLEIPMLARATAGEAPQDRLTASVAFAKSLLGEA